MADQLVSLGLTEIAHEIAGEPSLFARRGISAPTSDPGPDLPYEPDTITPSLTLGREITPNDLVSARTQARAGKPKAWFEIFDEMVRNGPGPQISKAKLALSSAKSAFLPPVHLRGEDDTSADATLARHIAELAAGQFGPRLPSLLDFWFEKKTHGVVGFHVVVEPKGLEGKFERVATVEKIPARRFEMNSETRAWEYRPFPNDATTAPVAPFVAAGSLALFHDGGGSVPLDMAGLNFQCVVPWAFASFAHRHLARLSELFGIPVRLVWYDETKKGQKEIAQRVGQRMGAAAWGAFPKGMEVEIKGALSGQGAGDVQEKLIRIADRTYDRVYHGHSQASNVEVGAGSRTSTEEAGQQARELDQARAVEAAVDLVEGLVRPWVRRNWGEDVAARLCPVLEIEIRERKDGLKFAQTAAVLTGLGVVSLDEEALVRDCGMPYTDDPEKAVQPRVTNMWQPGAIIPETGQTNPTQAELAAVVPFPAGHRLASVKAPDGAGEEIVGPYRDIIASAAREGVSGEQLLARLRHRTTDPLEAERLVSAIAANGLNALMSGIVGARARRKK